MGLLGKTPDKENQDQPEEELEIHGDPSSVVAWRIDALVSEGFDPLFAGMLATLSNWREAKPLLEAGCPERLVWEILL